ncbi:MAG: Ger(x)C family spore germination protein [Clostridiales bacterium]|nr:Ger(x)C family spore germination protein [Clostridiales bacterium]MCF8021875.1 Ger(x)C family spore germination protein [Clostridiales bacterium]
MKKIIICLMLICFVLTSAGCWNWIEIENRGLVGILGMDKAAEKGKIKVSMQMIKPSEIKGGKEGGGGAGEAVVVYTDTGNTPLDALRNISRKTGRKIFLPEISILVIGQELAREGVGPIMDFWRRDHETSLRTQVIISSGKAEEVLNTKIPTEKVGGFALDKMLEATKFHSKAPVNDILEFNNDVKSETSSPATAALKVIGKEKDPSKESFSPGKKIIIDGSAVFKDYKMTGQLTEEESRGMLWVKGKVKSGVIIIPVPGYEDKTMDLEIIRSSSKIKPEIKNGKLSINIKVKQEANISSIPPVDINIEKSNFIDKVKEENEKAIKKEVLASLSKARDLNADIFSIGEALHEKYPRQWSQYEKRWNDLFPYLNVKVQVDASIERTGMITNPLMVNSR